MILFAVCSPVATRIGAIAEAIAAWDRMSSGLVGSSTQGEFECGQFAHSDHGLVAAPTLIGVDGDPDVWAHGLASERQSADVLGGVSTDLQLDLPKSVSHRFSAEAQAFLVVVPEPPRRRRIRGEAVFEQLRNAVGSSRFGASQDIQGLCFGEGILEVPEVDERDDLVRRQSGQQRPEGLALSLRAQVPQGIQHSADCHVHHALFGPSHLSCESCTNRRENSPRS